MKKNHRPMSRKSQKTKKSEVINWKDHGLRLFIEFIAVGFGVFVGFWVNNCQEENKKHDLEQKYLQSFRDDIEDDSRQLERLVTTTKEKLDRVFRVENLLRNDEIAKDSSFNITIANVVKDMNSFEPFNPHTVTYESIKNSGNLDIISNYELMKDLVQYYDQQLEEKKISDTIYNSYIDEYFIPFMHKNTDFLNKGFINEMLLTNHEFTNLVIRYSQLIKQKLKFYETTLEACKGLEKKLK